jgi:hypothetical protein
MHSLSSRLVSPRLLERLRVERRAATRIRPPLPMMVQARLPGGEIQPLGVVHDISSTGLSLLARQPWNPGDQFHLLLTNAACTFALTIQMEIVRCHQLMNGEHYVAGRFDRALGPLEMQAFLL